MSNELDAKPETKIEREAKEAATLRDDAEVDRLAETASLLLSYSFLFNSWNEGPDAKLKVDGETGRIIAVSKQSVPTFGCHANNMIGTIVEQWLPERFREPHKKFRLGYRDFPKNRPMAYGRELAALRADGTEFACSIHLIYQYEGQGLVVEVTIRRPEILIAHSEAGG